ncbi:RBP11-like subunits of RNA polymerase [Ceraceosorus guamensis]|uniref:DNA-directed RNA polymerases I and III subunit RPAC2 n=1 Tax=Ceraceosorus guamensis TaxID=1522189 RepID=A0A316WA58_9BASI|nr:RBP11-like subunits of RNA polymerase [Ceraceosorus guamensis]PWN45621.1 RBP11-like subunits of RNA polymerase [Ceraceosorus guamensis]
MEVDGERPSLSDKIKILPGHAADMSAATFCLEEEDHTLGNSLRYMLMKDPQVEFCGYSNPHPSESKIHLRVQMYDGVSALDALHTALVNLEDLLDAIQTSYDDNLSKGDFERYEEKGTSEEALRAMVEKGREIEAAQVKKQPEKATALS